MTLHAKGLWAAGGAGVEDAWRGRRRLPRLGVPGSYLLPGGCHLPDDPPVGKTSEKVRVDIIKLRLASH